MDTISHFEPESSVQDVIHEPLFRDFGRLLFPVERGYWCGDKLNNLNLTWYGKPDTEETVDIVNTLYMEAVNNEQIFYDIYSEEEKKQDPAEKRYRPFLL